MRKKYEGNIPSKGSKGRGKKADPGVTEAFELAKKAFTELCLEKLKLIVNAPDPHGHGGSAENGNTCRTFLHETNREKTLAIYADLMTETEFEHLKLVLQEANVIYRTINTIGKMKTEDFRDYVKSAYYHWKCEFRFAKIKESIHWTLGHIAELVSLNDDYSLAESNEASLEVSHKRARKSEAHLARHTSVKDNCEDCLKKGWLDSHPKVRAFNKKKPKKNTRVTDEQAKVDSFFVKD